MKTPKHFKMDLAGLIQQYEERRQTWIEQCREEGLTWTPVQEKCFEGAFSMLMDVLKDLRTMKEQWESNLPMFRTTEQLLEDENGQEETTEDADLRDSR